MIRTAQNHQGDLWDFLSRYTYQPVLTARLDALAGQPFSQEVVNEIVLWKVNRYAPLPDEIRNALHTLMLEPQKHRGSECVLVQLLACDGVDLPMASTLLRFQAPDVFQIIDRHAYRAVFGEAYPLYPASSPQAKIHTYFKYLDALHRLAQSSGVQFRDLDRILYIFDKEQNGTLSLKPRKT
jgi:thermostable 8-oxoguanine DNA glycosylase